MALSTLPVTINIDRKRGDTKPFEFTMQDELAANVPFAGYSFLLTADPSRKPVDATNNLFQISGTSPGDGVIVFDPVEADVDAVGTYYYDLQTIDATGDIITVAEGKMKFTQDITK